MQVNYFDMGAICDVKAPPWSGEDITPFAEFLRAYAEYVLYRTTQFGPGFEELLVRGRSISYVTYGLWLNDTKYLFTVLTIL